MYEYEEYNSKDEWLKARGIGSSEASAIVNKSKWLTPIDVFKKLVLHKEPKIKENSRMREGTLAEEHIRALFGLDNPEYMLVEPPKDKYWLFRDSDYPLITCTPDGLLKKGEELYGLEIKDVELRKATDIRDWEVGKLPDQYYFQILQYMVVIEDLKGVCLNAHLKYFEKNNETDTWEFSYAIDRPYWVYREEVKEHINYLKNKEIDFIVNNVQTKKLPTVKVQF